MLALDIQGGVWPKISMPSTSASPSSPSHLFGPLLGGMTNGDAPLGGRFLAPLEAILPKLTSTRACPELPDSDWLALGVLRVLHAVPSGRGFLQEIGPGLDNCPDVGRFFDALRSERRLALCSEADALLAASLSEVLPDALAGVPELDGFDVYAGDGHWHRAAAHDRRPFPDAPKSSCGHFYALATVLEHESS